MTSDRLTADLAFIGHVSFHEIAPFMGTASVAPGSAVLRGAMAAARIGADVAVVTRMDPRDDRILASLRQVGIAVHVVPARVTTYMRVVHRRADVDDREMYQLANAGRFSSSEIPDLDVQQVHLAGITDQEFSLDFVHGLKSLGYRLSADMQGFLRQVDQTTRRISFADVPDTAAIIALLDMVKLDVAEARILTGTDNLEQAALRFEKWGCPEILITGATGVLARVRGKTYWEPFTNRSEIGRTGRGDATFAAYITRRIDHYPEESLRFAAALASIKIEKTRPFDVIPTDVMGRMNMKAAS